jgi:outer membrane receptor protein involved in Fe transport
MELKRRLFSLFFFISTILFSFPLFAEGIDTVSIQPISLDEVVVRSFKQDGNFRTLPVSTSTINRIAIENQNITNIKDVSSFIPNLFMPDYGSKLTSPIYIRGIGSKINSPSVGLYVDGIPFFEKSAFDFDFNEIEAIEVLRGPQGTLYGRNTMGGLINIHTKSPLQYQETRVSASAGNYENLNGALSHYGKIGGTFGYAVSGNYNHSGGYFTNLYTGEKVDESDSGSGRIRLEWRIKPNLSLKLMNILDKSAQGGYPYALVNPLTTKTGQVNYNDYSSYQRTISSTGASLIYTTEKISLNSQTAFQYLTDKQGIDQDFSPDNKYFAKQNQKQSALSQELTIKSIFPGRYRWLFGVFAFRQNIDNEIIVEYKAQNYDTQKLYGTPTSGISAYHQSILENLFIDRLSLTLGIRYDYERATTDYAGYRNQAGKQSLTDEFDSQLNFNQVTPKIALQYTLPSSQLFSASVSKGYKTGGFNTSFETDEDRSFDPEYSWNYEIGSKLSFWENRIRTEISLFYIDWKNQQIYQTLPSGIGQMLKNAGRSESKGVEISVQGRLFKNFNLQTNWGYTKATFKKHKKDKNTDYSGNYLPLVPSQTLAIGGDYKIPISSGWADELNINLSYTGTGRLYWIEDNQVSQPYYGLLNGKIAATKGQATLSVWAKNISNTDYTVFYFETAGNGLAQRGKPFTIGTSLTVRLRCY